MGHEKLKVLDLFSGIGGFSLGLERTGGFETVAFCEIDPFCQKVLKKHWPDVPIYNDVRTLDYDGTVDVITGGFPCQDISNAGASHGVNVGIAGRRSGLWKSYHRIIQEKSPSFVIIENVKALFVKGMEVVLQDLAQIGYDAVWHVIPASRVGSVQLRERIWIIAYPSSVGKQRFFQSIDFSKTRQGRACRQEDLQQVYANPLGGNSWPQPIICGGRGRFPGWVDRIKSLGNTVDPGVTEIIGYAILEANNATK